MEEFLKDTKKSAIRIVRDKKLLIPTLLSAYGAAQLGFSLRKPNWFDILVFGLFVIYCIYEFFTKKEGIRKAFIGKIILILVIAVGIVVCFGFSIEAIAAATAFFIITLLVELFSHYLKAHIFPDDLGWLSSEIAAFVFMVAFAISFFIPASC